LLWHIVSPPSVIAFIYEPSKVFLLVVAVEVSPCEDVAIVDCIPCAAAAFFFALFEALRASAPVVDTVVGAVDTVVDAADDGDEVKDFAVEAIPKTLLITPNAGPHIITYLLLECNGLKFAFANCCSLLFLFIGFMPAVAK
jgi:hypothetical protein